MVYPWPDLNKEVFYNKAIDEILDDKQHNDLFAKVENWAYQGSEWSVHLMLQHQLNVLEMVSCKGSSYLPLSKELNNSVKGLITNIQSECKEGFVWCLIGYFNPVKIQQ